ncbi:Hsp20/alpha crystallin family protein [Nocardia stercoris]|uniref:Hsp20/alpha crystallin family protein n=1 Tax=Nocardia stercoris TaxID=2483361 RepID=A0A3M2L764_9NOCA|nr:Hsp20/alpha crystallin family protein [Nocardia stercoris]RMI33552.1 Hsp20/alpha crystallin family protein [Nocardia stercoris]
MSKLAPHRQPQLLPELADLWNTFAPSPLPWSGTHLIRVEDDLEEGAYVLRAEIPGIDPDKDLSVSVQHGRLSIKAERSEKHEEKGHSEFSYGSFVRTVTLPVGAQEDGITANYAKGILTVTVPMAAEPEKATTIAVTSSD